MKKKIETSKMIMLVSYVIAIILSIIVVIGTFMGYEISGVTTIASLAWAEVATGNIWYFKKATKENVPKVIASMPKELREQIDINTLLNEEGGIIWNYYKIFYQ